MSNESIVALAIVFGTQLVIYLQSRRNQEKIHELHLSLNSRLDALLASVAAQARSEGHAAGVLQQQQKDKNL